MDYTTFKKYLHKDRKQIISFSEHHNNIWLYGAGRVASLMYAYLQEENIPVKGAIVSEKNTKDILEDVNVIKFSDCVFENSDGIILAVAEKMQDEVEKVLLNHGIIKENIYRQRIFYSGNTINEEDYYRGDCSNGRFFYDFNELDEFGLKYDTDKAGSHHNYLRKYEFFLRRFKDVDVKVLELGVFKGASLNTWASYFPNGEVYGVDIDSSCKQYEGNNKHVIITDLSDIENLENLCSIKPDIVIDDASHCWSHQIKAITVIFDSLPSGGIYICEDLGTSFYRCKDSWFADCSISGFDYLNAINRVMNGGIDELYKCEVGLSGEIKRIASQVDMISFIYGSCIIVKK